MNRAVACLAVVLVLAACQSPEQQAREQLQEQVGAVREAAEAGDQAAAAQRLDELRTSVARMQLENLVTSRQAERILIAALHVQANLAHLSPQLVTPPAPAPPPAPPPAQVDEPDSNAGGSVRGVPGDRGERGARGERGRPGGDDDDDDDD